MALKCGYLCCYFLVQDKWTALIFAAKDGHLDIVKGLLTKGAEIDHTDVVSIKYYVHFFLVFCLFCLRLKLERRQNSNICKFVLLQNEQTWSV